MTSLLQLRGCSTIWSRSSLMISFQSIAFVFIVCSVLCYLNVITMKISCEVQDCFSMVSAEFLLVNNDSHRVQTSAFHHWWIRLKLYEGSSFAPRQWGCSVKFMHVFLGLSLYLITLRSWIGSFSCLFDRLILVLTARFSVMCQLILFCFQGVTCMNQRRTSN